MRAGFHLLVAENEHGLSARQHEVPLGVITGAIRARVSRSETTLATWLLRPAAALDARSSASVSSKPGGPKGRARSAGSGLTGLVGEIRDQIDKRASLFRRQDIRQRGFRRFRQAAGMRNRARRDGDEKKVMAASSWLTEQLKVEGEGESRLAILRGVAARRQDATIVRAIFEVAQKLEELRVVALHTHAKADRNVAILPASFFCAAVSATGWRLSNFTAGIALELVEILLLVVSWLA